VFVSKRSSEIRVAVPAPAPAACPGDRVRGGAQEALRREVAEGLTVPADGMATDIHGSAEYRAT